MGKIDSPPTQFPVLTLLIPISAREGKTHGSSLALPTPNSLIYVFCFRHITYRDLLFIFVFVY